MIVLVSAYKFKEAQTLLSMVKLSLEMSLEAIGTNVL